MGRKSFAALMLSRRSRRGPTIKSDDHGLEMISQSLERIMAGDKES